MENKEKDFTSNSIHKHKWLVVFISLFCLFLIFVSAFVPTSYTISDVYKDSKETIIDGWYFDGKEYKSFGKELNTNKATITRTFNIDSKRPKAIGFSNYYCAVEVFFDGVSLFKYGDESDLNNKLLGNLYSIVELPNNVDGEHKVDITYTSKNNLTIYPIDYGNAIGLSNSQYNEYIMVIILSAISAAVLISIIVFKFRKASSSLISYKHFWLAVSIVLSTLWVIADSQLPMTLGLNAGRVCQVSFNLYMLFPIALEMFQHYATDELKKLGSYFCWISIARYVVVVLLDLFNIASFLDTLMISHIFTIITMIIVLYQVVNDYKNKHSQVTLFNMISTCGFIALSVIQYAYFFVDPTKSNTKLLSIGLIIFYLLQLLSIVYEIGRKTKEEDDKYRSIIEETNRKLLERSELLYKTFGRFVPNENIENILNAQNHSSIQGERTEATILQSDLRGFTSITSQMNAQDAVDMLNNYLSKMTEIIVRYKGTVIEFIGDSVLAVFGSPIVIEDHASSAIAAALKMQLAMKDVNEYNKEHGYPELQMGIGIDTGTVYIGYLGSERHMKFDVIGSAVNLCSRIESYSIGGQILASDNTIELSKNVDVLTSEQVLPKGFDKPIGINSVSGIGSPYNITYTLTYDVPMPVDQDIKITFNVIKDKHIEQEEHIGYVKAVSKNALLLDSKDSIDLLIDIRINSKYELIGKVVTSSVKGVLVRFTQVPNNFDGWGYIK